MTPPNTESSSAPLKFSDTVGKNGDGGTLLLKLDWDTTLSTRLERVNAGVLAAEGGEETSEVIDDVR